MREVGIGVVVWNETGEVLAALSKKKKKNLLPHSAVALEVIATQRVVQFISELVISQSVFDGDLEVFCNSLFTKNSSLSVLVILLKKLHLW